MESQERDEVSLDRGARKSPQINEKTKKSLIMANRKEFMTAPTTEGQSKRKATVAGVG